MIRRWMVPTFVAALTVRLVYWATFHDSLFARYLLVDAAWHDQWAWDWARGVWNQTEAFYRAPLYPYVLSLVYQVFGHSLTAVRLLQAVLGASAAAALAGAGYTLAGPGAALAAGLLAALYGPLVYFDGELLIPSLLVALLSWGLFFALRARSARGAAWAGLWFGLAAVARPNALVLAFPLLWVVGKAAGGVRPRAWMLLWILMPALYVTFLNYRVEQSPVFISSQGGFNFYAGNHALASGRSPAIPEVEHATSWREVLEESREVAERDRGRSLSSAERSAYWTGRAWSWMRNHPGDWAALTGKKLYYLLNAYEIPNNRNPYLNRPLPLRPLLWTSPLFSFPWGLVFPLAVVGLAALWPRDRRGAGLLAGWLAIYGLSVAVFFVCSRFRMGMTPALLVAAAVPFGLGVGRIPRRAWVLGAVALVLCNTAWWGVRERNVSQELTKLGALQLESGQRQVGVETLEASLAQDPKDVTTQYLLADTYYDLGRYADALPLFEQVVARRPRDHRARFALGLCYAYLNRMEASQEALEEAARIKPKDASTWSNLGTVYAARGLPEKAVEAFERAITVEPNADKAYVGLALAYVDLKAWDRAEAVLLDLRRCCPDNPDWRPLLKQIQSAGRLRTNPDSTGSDAGGR